MTAQRHLALLGVIVAMFVVISAWNIGDAGFSGFYSSAARSMSVSWRAFFFGTFDPAGTITLDKLAGFDVPQALSARLFGFSPTSIALPQVIEGAVTIVAVDRIGARWRDETTGLVAAAAFATMPLMVSMFGHVMEDGLLTMSLALAVVFWQRATRSSRLLPLVVSALWVGVGFQAKMLQAWFVVPAIVVGLLLVAEWTWGRRLARVGLWACVAVLASLSWMIVVQLTPAGSRPSIDGSTNDSVFSMVFGYNGVNRFVTGLVPGAAPQFVVGSIGAHSPGASPWKLLLPEYTTQVGWLFPLVVAGIVLTLRVRPRATAVLLVVWLGVAVMLLSAAVIPHTAYLAALGVPAAVLAGAGLVEARRRGGWVLIVTLLAQAAWVVAILMATRIAPWWLIAVVAVAAVLTCALALVVGRLERLDRLARLRRFGRSRGSGARRAAAVLALVTVFAAPAAWTGSTLDLSLAGSANDAYGGPRLDSVGFFFQAPGSTVDRTTFEHFSIGPPVLASSAPALTPEQRHLVAYTKGRVPKGAPLFTASSWDAASPYILSSGLDVVSLGGFSGRTPSPTLRQVEHGVMTGQRRFFLLPTETSGQEASAHATERRRVEAWVAAACSYVPDDVYAGATTLPGQSLWDCRDAAPTG